MTWQEKIREEWARRQNSQVKKDGHFPLVFQNFTSDEIVSMVEVVMSGQLTMAHNVRKFEAEFAKFVGAPFAVMVNSGSSANLLAFAVATNPRRRHHLKAGDEVIVPAVCWSTSVWPIMQMGLKPVLVDVVPETLNINLEELKKAITPQTKAVLAVHVLGNATDMLALSVFCAEHGLILIEDTCESLGAKANGKMLGTIGEMGTYSFFFSHHMTTGEGGMVVCQSQEDYDLLRNLRAHGWTRELSNRVALETQHPDVDPRFLFVNVGYNFRPMEIQAALGLKQLEKLPAMNANRKYNNDRIIEALRAHSKWNNQYMFTQPGPEVEPAWFGFCLQLTGKHISKRAAFLKELSQMGVENRPIVSGNFARQPALKLFGIDLIPEDFPGAEQIHQAGFFIGVHTEKLRPDQISDLAHKLLSLF